MNHRQLLDMLGHDGSSLEMSCACVDYRFDFCFTPHSTALGLLHEIGRNDVDIPVVMNGQTGQIHLLDERGLSFLNSSFQQFRRSVNVANDGISEGLSNQESAEVFSRRMRQIDPMCFSDPEGCWSVMREEIGNGTL